MTLRITSVIGHSNDPELHQRLHTLSHAGNVEYVTLKGQDLARKRLRTVTDQGTECTISLPRDVQLEHGSVLAIDERQAIVVELEELPWLILEARQPESALKLGFLAGHHHWRVKFERTRMHVALDQPLERYLERIQDLIDQDAVEVLDAGNG